VLSKTGEAVPDVFVEGLVGMTSFFQKKAITAFGNLQSIVDGCALVDGFSDEDMFATLKARYTEQVQSLADFEQLSIATPEDKRLTRLTTTAATTWMDILTQPPQVDKFQYAANLGVHCTAYDMDVMIKCNTNSASLLSTLHSPLRVAGLPATTGLVPGDIGADQCWIASPQHLCKEPDR
jgi:hypothetical protein